MAASDWSTVIVAAISALAAAYAAWLAKQNGADLRTNGPLTIGQHVSGLQAELASIAQAKLVADAQLASAALTAVARLTDGKDSALSAAADLAAKNLLQTAASLTSPTHLTPLTVPTAQPTPPDATTGPLEAP